MSRWASTAALEAQTGRWEIWLTTKSILLTVSEAASVSPQRSVTLNLDDVQGIEVGDKEVGLSVGCDTERYEIKHIKV